MDARDIASLCREEKEAAAMDLCARFFERGEASAVAGAVIADARSYPHLPPTLCDCYEQIEYCTEKQLDGYLSAEES